MVHYRKRKPQDATEATPREHTNEFLSRSQFAAAIGVVERTVERHVAAGKLVPHHRTPGGHCRFARDQVQEYFHSQHGESRFLKPGQFAAATGLRPDTVVRRIAAGKLKPHHHTPGGHARFTQEQVVPEIERPTRGPTTGGVDAARFVREMLQRRRLREIIKAAGRKNG